MIMDNIILLCALVGVINDCKIQAMGNVKFAYNLFR